MRQVRLRSNAGLAGAHITSYTMGTGEGERGQYSGIFLCQLYEFVEVYLYVSCRQLGTGVY